MARVTHALLNPGTAYIMGEVNTSHGLAYFDLTNDNVECEDGAVWENNIFETASQACIE